MALKAISLQWALIYFFKKKLMNFNLVSVLFYLLYLTGIYL